MNYADSSTTLCANAPVTQAEVDTPEGNGLTLIGFEAEDIWYAVFRLRVHADSYRRLFRRSGRGWFHRHRQQEPGQ